MKIYTNETLKIKIARHKKVGVAVRAILWILVAFSVVCIGIALCQKLFTKNKTVNIFGLTPFIVSSGSMTPDLQVNDIVVVRKVNEGKISTGDIISFFDGSGNIVTHRVQDIVTDGGKKYYITKGDANNAVDADRVTYDKIIGRYCFRLPSGGYVIAAITSPAGIVLIVLIIAFVCILIYRNNSRKNARRELRARYKMLGYSNADMQTEADGEGNVLIISQPRNAVILPRSTVEAQSASDEIGENDEANEDVKSEQSVPLSRYRYGCISRFKEAYALVRKRENGSVWAAIDLATELFFKRFLHPAVIAACVNSDQLDVYLDCLEKNETGDFPFFKICCEPKPKKAKPKRKQTVCDNVSGG